MDDSALCTYEDFSGTRMPSKRMQPSDQRNHPRVPLATQQPSITRTYKILRGELLPHYYNTEVSIHAGLGCSASGTFGKWLRAIGRDNRRMISGVYVSVFSVSVSSENDGLDSRARERR